MHTFKELIFPLACYQDSSSENVNYLFLSHSPGPIFNVIMLYNKSTVYVMTNKGQIISTFSHYIILAWSLVRQIVV